MKPINPFNKRKDRKPHPAIHKKRMKQIKRLGVSKAHRKRTRKWFRDQPKDSGGIGVKDYFRMLGYRV